jgi:hypothetical protein
MTLLELIKAVKEKNLSKEDLEQYRDQMSMLFAEIQLEMAELEKLEAMFPTENYPTAVARKNAWKQTTEGQRLIVLKRYSIALKELLNSLKSRIYQLIF